MPRTDTSEERGLADTARLHYSTVMSTAPRRRLGREIRTLDLMVDLYCSHHHGKGSAACADCQELKDYAHTRTLGCRFGAKKPVCSACTVHCYRPDMRERVRLVMRWAGPKMVYTHPSYALLHAIDSLTHPMPEIPQKP